MLLEETSGEAAGPQGQPGQQGAAGQQTGEGLGHTITQWVHAQVQLLQALWRGKARKIKG